MDKIQINLSLENSLSRIPGLIPTVEMGYYKYNNNWLKIYDIDEINYIEENENYIEVLSNNDFKDTNVIYFSYGLNGINGINGNWGKCVMDIDISLINDPSFDIIKTFNLPFVKYYDNNIEHLVLRHNTMMAIYYWLYNFYKKTKYYKLCIRNDKKKWLEYNNINIINDNYNFYPILPNSENFNVGDIIGVNDEYSKLSFMFGNERYDIIYFNFVEKSFGKLRIDSSINGKLVPEFLYYTEVLEWYNWLNNNFNSNDCCIKKKYIDMGGDNMKTFLAKYANDDLVINTLRFFKKIIANKLLLNNNNLYPYINIPISITSLIDDIGEYTLYTQEWISGKRYYVGDVVIYRDNDDTNGSSYVLDKGYDYELIEMDDNFYNTALNNSITYIIKIFDTEKELKTFCYNEMNYYNKNFIENGHKIILFEQENNKCYLPLAFYDGFFNENDKNIYFDDVIDEEIILNHWRMNSSPDDIKNINIDGYDNNWPNVYLYDSQSKQWHWVSPSSQIKSKLESKILSLKRLKISYDDNGNELPGIINYYYDNGIKIISENLESPFLAGEVHNLTKVNGENNEIYYYGDIIESIQYSIDGINFTLNKENAKFIKFIYYIGCKLFMRENENGVYWSIYENDDDTSFHGGTKYEEIYYVYINNKLSDTIVDGNIITFYYDKIEFNSSYITIYNEDVDFAPQKVIISNTVTNSNELFDVNEINNSYNIINSLLYKEEYKLGISTPIKKDISVYIDRGVNSAFERHLILGEINTFQDLENYKNDYFKLNKMV